jgi:hypothetical protein
MPRIAQAQLQERNTFLLELIRSQPDITRQEAQERFEDRFDATLSPKAFQQIREQALAARTGPAAEERSREEAEPTDSDSEPHSRPAASAPESGNGASAQPAKAKAKGGKQRSLFVEAPREQLVFLERTIQQLQEAGATNVRVEHSTERWMVLAVDAR